MLVSFVSVFVCRCGKGYVDRVWIGMVFGRGLICLNHSLCGVRLWFPPGLDRSYLNRSNAKCSLNCSVKLVMLMYPCSMCTSFINACSCILVACAHRLSMPPSLIRFHGSGKPAAAICSVVNGGGGISRFVNSTIRYTNLIKAATNRIIHESGKTAAAIDSVANGGDRLSRFGEAASSNSEHMSEGMHIIRKLVHTIVWTATIDAGITMIDIRFSLVNSMHKVVYALYPKWCNEKPPPYQILVYATTVQCTSSKTNHWQMHVNQASKFGLQRPRTTYPNNTQCHNKTSGAYVTIMIMVNDYY